MPAAVICCIFYSARFFHVHTTVPDMCAGPTQGAALDGSPDPGPPAAPTPSELDPRTSPEPAEPSLKKRKIPRLAASSQVRDEPECITLEPVETGSHTGTADADGSCGRQPSSGEII